MELTLSEKIISTSCLVILSFLVGDVLMELMLSENIILTSCWVILSFLVGEFLMHHTLV